MPAKAGIQQTSPSQFCLIRQWLLDRRFRGDDDREAFSKALRT